MLKEEKSTREDRRRREESRSTRGEDKVRRAPSCGGGGANEAGRSTANDPVLLDANALHPQGTTVVTPRREEDARPLLADFLAHHADARPPQLIPAVAPPPQSTRAAVLPLPHTLADDPPLLATPPPLIARNTKDPPITRSTRAPPAIRGTTPRAQRTNPLRTVL